MCTLPSQCMSQCITEEAREDLEAGTEVEAVEECYLLTCCSGSFLV